MEDIHIRAPLPRGTSQRILRIGHRGAAGHAPENTIAAIRKGASLGVDFVELDVQCTRDGRLVVMHDKLVDRTTDGSGLVSDMTWDKLQLLDAGLDLGTHPFYQKNFRRKSSNALAKKRK